VKGIIFNDVEDAVSRSFGIDTWETLLDAAEVSGVYSAIGDYPTAELVALVEAAAEHLGMTEEQIWGWVGEHIVPVLQERYPHFFDGHRNSTEFLSSAGSVVHGEVRKLYEGARPPRFSAEAVGDGRLLLTYRSDRGLADLAEGVVHGVAGLYGEHALVERSDAADGEARLLCAFTSLEGAGSEEMLLEAGVPWSS
jgi:hypothetical protein